MNFKKIKIMKMKSHGNDRLNIKLEEGNMEEVDVFRCLGVDMSADEFM